MMKSGADQELGLPPSPASPAMPQGLRSSSLTRKHTLARRPDPSLHGRKRTSQSCMDSTMNLSTLMSPLSRNSGSSGQVWAYSEVDK